MITSNNSYYGAYRTRTFKDIFPDDYSFITCMNDSPISLKGVTDDEYEILHYLLYAKYGNSHIASSDENQFKAKLQLNIYSYYPIYKRKKTAIDELLAKTEQELRLGQEFISENQGSVESESESSLENRSVNNHALNPSEIAAEKNIDEDTMLTYINDQVFSKGNSSNNNSSNSTNREHTTTTGRTALLNAYNDYLNLLASYEEEFLATFKKLFITIVSPQASLYYEENINE